MVLAGLPDVYKPMIMGIQCPGILDFVTAFLESEVDEEIYIMIPEGIKDKRSDLVCRLKKSLYGKKVEYKIKR